VTQSVKDAKEVKNMKAGEIYKAEIGFEGERHCEQCPLKGEEEYIKKVIEGLELIETVIPSYKHARRKGLTDDEAETVVNWALEQAIILLEQLIGATDE
jgi:hypothetical protein